MNNKIILSLSALFLLLFILFTISLTFIDVKPIGPNESFVGYASLNGWFHNFTGVNMLLYNITDYGGIPPIVMGMAFGVVGFVQLVKRKSIKRVDKELIILGLFYILVFIVYLAFEFIVVNRRPILINGYLEASYPSSTTFLSITFMISAIPLVKKYFKNKNICFIIKGVFIAYMLFLVIGRILSGVHWLTDIVGAILISVSLLYCYKFFVELYSVKQP